MAEKKRSTFNMIRTMKKNPFILSTVLAGLLALVFIILFVTRPCVSGKTVSEQEAIQETINLVKDVFGVDMSYVSRNTDSEGDVYSFNFQSSEGLPITLEVTKDMKFLKLPSGYWVKVSDLRAMAEQKKEQNKQKEEEKKKIPKKEKPIVELFVMTYCPYGLQAEKGMIPVIKLLDGLADIKIRFVHYFMHGQKEEDETYRQVCIREEQPNKFISYLECFVNSSDSSSCLEKAGIDENKLDDCIENRAKDYYANDKKLSQQYNVPGSPTLVINGQQLRFSWQPRSPAKALELVCLGFTTPPEECSTEISDENPSPGFGNYAGSSNVAGQC